MPTADDIRGGRGFWLLDLVFGGQTFRFATAAIVISRQDGGDLFYRIGLDDFAWNVGTAGMDAKIGLKVRTDVDWADMVARAIPLERAAGVLRRWYEGQTFEESEVVLRGITDRIEYGATDEPLVLSLISAPVEQSDTLPPPQARVDDFTWPKDLPERDEKITGAPYSIVIGAPGDVGAATAQPVTPGLMVDFLGNSRFSKVLIAGHAVAATEVEVYDLTDSPVQATRPVETTTDALGRTISHINFVGAGGFTQAADRKWYIGWRMSDGGGLLSDDRQSGVRGAGDVLRIMLERFTRIPIDRGRMIAESAALNEYKIDAYINKPINVWTWVTREVVQLLPVLPIETSEGLYWRWLNWNATQVDAVAFLNADTREIERTTPVRTLGDPIANEVTIEFAPHATSQRYSERRVITAEAGVVVGLASGDPDTRALASYKAKQSQQVYDIKPITISTSAVWDPATASRIGVDVINRQALPKRRIGYVGGPELASLEVGSIVVLTDSEISINGEVAILFAVRIEKGAQTALDLVLVDNITGTPRVIA